MSRPRVEVGGDGQGALAVRLAGVGAVVVTGADANAPALRVVITSDYLSEHHAAFHAGGASAVPWVLIQPTGVRALFGPIFGPDGSCWRCPSPSRWRRSAAPVPRGRSSLRWVQRDADQPEPKWGDGDS